MCHKFLQTRGEIMHEFSLIEYDVRSALAHFLESQPKRTLNKYMEQFGRLLKALGSIQTELNPKVLENPDVQRMDAEIAATDGGFYNCLEQLPGAAEKADFSKMLELRSLVTEIKAATLQRNLLTHSVWLEVQGKIVMQNFPDYHKGKWMLIKGDGERLTPQRSREWTLQELQTFTADLHDLSEQLTNLFQ